jgi:RimJ/RimL family protein N-acetyltransferase
MGLTKLGRAHLPIETPRLTLRLPSRVDVPDLRRSFRNPRTARAVGAPLHSREEMRDPEKMVARTRSEFRKGDHLSLSVLERRSGRCVGRVGLRGLSWTYRKVESLSYWIDPPFWNRGYATEASYFLCREAFGRLGMRRIGSQALDRNLASLAVLRRLGFVEEGRERAAVCWRGECMDMVLFGLLKGEMLPEARLAPVWNATGQRDLRRPAPFGSPGPSGPLK